MLASIPLFCEISFIFHIYELNKKVFMVSNLHFISNDAQMFSVSKAFTGEITLEKLVNVLAQSNQILYYKIYELLENKIGKENAQKLFSEAKEIIENVKTKKYI